VRRRRITAYSSSSHVNEGREAMDTCLFFCYHTAATLTTMTTTTHTIFFSSSSSFSYYYYYWCCSYNLQRLSLRFVVFVAALMMDVIGVVCPFVTSSSQDAFVVQESPTRFFIWYGAMCSNMERKRAARTAVHIYTNLTEDDEEEEEQLAHLNTEEIFISCEEGQESAQFWNAIGGKGLYAKFTASATNAAGNERLENPILYQASLIRHYLMVQEVIDFTHEDLHEAGVYLLDMHFTIFVWRGAYASERLVEGAEKLAKAIAKQRCDDDAKFVSVTTGKEPLEFTHAFLGWHEVSVVGRSSITKIHQESLLCGLSVF